MKWLLLLIALLAGAARAETVGSKKFTEGVILGEVARLAIERAGVPPLTSASSAAAASCGTH